MRLRLPLFTAAITLLPCAAAFIQKCFLRGKGYVDMKGEAHTRQACLVSNLNFCLSAASATPLLCPKLFYSFCMSLLTLYDERGDKEDTFSDFL